LEHLATVAFYFGVIVYTVAGTLFFLDLVRNEGLSVGARWAPRLLAAGALFHSVHLVTASLLTRVCPVESVNFALSLAGLIATTVFLFLRKRSRLHVMGAFVAPLALAFLVSAEFVSASSPSQVPRAMLAFHITANILGVGLFMLAGAASVFYLVQERRLKQKRVHFAGSRLPPLDALDTTEHRLLLAGFPLLTFGVVSGAIFINQIGPLTSAASVRAVLGYATWVLVAGVLILRSLAGWRGRRAAWGTLAGVVCVLLVILMYAISPGAGQSL
jgi:ABC-type uncharacterized transport system permease subunit